MLKWLMRSLTRKRDDPTGDLVVGLQNPGSRYAGTRHNIGADIVRQFVARHDLTFEKAPKRIPADLATWRAEVGIARLMIPRTFMNESGRAVGPVIAYFRPERLVVVHDDIDLELGVVRVHFERGSGGHNGIKDIARVLGRNDFWRIRIGVGRPPGRMDPADYVLQRFSPEERTEVDVLIAEVVDVLVAFIQDGEEAARQKAGHRRASD